MQSSTFKAGSLSNTLPKQGTIFFIFLGRELLLSSESQLPSRVPLHLQVVRSFQFGMYGQNACVAVEVEGKIPEGYRLINVRHTYSFLGEEWFRIAGHAYHLLHWERTHLFCGACGNETQRIEQETARVCIQCGHKTYPRISPAIIVAVTQQDYLLMAHAKRYPKRMFSVLAGFVEPGESLEECVQREVKEEANIEIKNIRYFGSQPWPFPDALMIGFTAEYAGGILQADEQEIQEIGWFHKDNLPQEIPGKLSIARQLIDAFLNK